jgi:hypothetical protein
MACPTARVYWMVSPHESVEVIDDKLMGRSRLAQSRLQRGSVPDNPRYRRILGVPENILCCKDGGDALMPTLLVR